ncbi:MAG: sulfite exporter TauE/SafE family protein [Anaerolineae bacterium]
MSQEVVLVIIGFVAGILAGMFGIGGGVVIVPALMGTLAFSIHQATGTSLAALLLPVGIFAVISYYRKGFLSISKAALVTTGLFFGSWFGAQIALGLDTVTLQRIYGVFLLYVCWRFTEPIKWYAEIRARMEKKKLEETKAEENAAEPKIAWYWICCLDWRLACWQGCSALGRRRDCSGACGLIAL